jgi:hypothetical protein
MIKSALTPEMLYELMRQHDSNLSEKSGNDKRILENAKINQMWEDFLDKYCDDNVDEANDELYKVVYAYNETGFIAGFKACRSLLLNAE